MLFQNIGRLGTAGTHSASNNDRATLEFVDSGNVIIQTTQRDVFRIRYMPVLIISRIGNVYHNRIMVTHQIGQLDRIDRANSTTALAYRIKRQ